MNTIKTLVIVLSTVTVGCGKAVQSGGYRPRADQINVKAYAVKERADRFYVVVENWGENTVIIDDNPQVESQFLSSTIISPTSRFNPPRSEGRRFAILTPIPKVRRQSTGRVKDEQLRIEVPSDAVEHGTNGEVEVTVTLRIISTDSEGHLEERDLVKSTKLLVIPGHF